MIIIYHLLDDIVFIMKNRKLTNKVKNNLNNY